MSEKFRYLILILILIVPLAAAAPRPNNKITSPPDQTEAKKKRVGVLSFEARSVPTSEAAIVSDIFRNELVATEVVEVLDRNNMENILKEQAFQQSGCTDSSCAVQIGKMLNMEAMIYGLLMKAGNNYYISIEMIDVESSQILKSAREQFTSMNQVDKVIIALVEQLTGQKKKVEDLNKFKLFIEEIGGAVNFGFGSPDLNVPMEGQYRGGIGGEIFIQGRLFGTEKDVIKNAWLFGGNINQYNYEAWEDDPSRQRVQEANSLWISGFVYPATAIKLRFGKLHLFTGAGFHSVYLIENGKINENWYSTKSSFIGLGINFKIFFKMAKHLSLHIGSCYEIANYLSADNRILDNLRNNNYNYSRGVGTIGISF